MWQVILVILIQVLVFGIVIYALKRIMVGNTESAVNRLNQSYADISKKKEEMANKINQIEQECERQRRETSEEIKKMREEAQKEVEEKTDKMLSEARQKSEQIIGDALGAKNKIREEIKREEQLKVVDWAGQIINAVLSREIKKELNDAFVEEILEDIRELEAEHVPVEISEVDFIVAEDLRQELKGRLEKIIAGRLNRDVSFNCKVDKGLIAGIAVKFGSLILDQSLSNKLNQQLVAMKAKIEDS